MDKVFTNDYSGLLKKYQTGVHPVLRQARDGGSVIGDAVDSANRLLYVIQRGNTITVEYAEQVPVVYSQRQGSPVSIKVAAGR